MGAGQSGGIDIGGSSMGYQVLRVYPNSPGSRAGLKAYFDFIVAIGNTRFNKENGSLREILKASVDQKLKMVVLNTRTKKTRDVEIIPSMSWGGNGLLGVSIKHSSFDRADERVWHVVEVEPGSPAFQAGFKAGEDYVIGSDSILQENDDLYNLVEAHEGKALKLFLYNINTDNCREVICHPNSKWGGKGYLGCEFGHGLLHRIPYVDDEDNSPKASLLRNEQPPATQEVSNPSNNPFSFQNQLMGSQIQQLQKPTQPGQQLFQQALFNQPSPQNLELNNPPPNAQNQQQVPQPDRQQNPFPNQQPAIQLDQQQQSSCLNQQPNLHPNQQLSAAPVQQPGAVPVQQPGAVPVQQPSTVPVQQPNSYLDQQQQSSYLNQQPSLYPNQQPNPYLEQQQQSSYLNQQQNLYPNQQQNLYPNQQQSIYPNQQQSVYPNQQQSVYPNQQQNVYPNQQQNLYPNQQPNPYS